MSVANGLFDAFRRNGAPTFYEPLHTPVQGDLIVGGLIFCFVIIAFSFYVILPGIRGKERIFTFIRVTVSLFIGAVILVTNFEMTWEGGETTGTPMKYKAGTGEEITATLNVQIGLRGINVTLKGEPENQLNETINYNEHFSWEWRQGRFGFGPFAGRFQQEYRAAQYRGLPLPILWVAEYFTLDGEGIRWGRHYRQAGWYCHIVLWVAFPLWLLTNFLFLVLLRYGAFFLAFTGAVMLTVNIIWASIRNFNDLVIPFSAEHKIEFAYGGSFWVCLATGIICILLGIVVFIMDLRCPQAIAAFFGVDALQDSEELQVEREVAATQETNPDDDVDDDESRDKDGDQQARNGQGRDQGGEEAADDDIYLDVEVLPQQMRPAKTLTHRITKKFQKPRRMPPPPPRYRQSNDENPEELYENSQPRLFHKSGSYDNNVAGVRLSQLGNK